jgi:putative transposase
MVRYSRLEAHHTLALRIVGDNRAICVVDLAVSWVAWTPLAKSVADACWSSGVRLLVAEGAALPPAVGASVAGSARAGCARGVGPAQGEKPLAVRFLDLRRVWHHRRLGI